MKELRVALLLLLKRMMWVGVLMRHRMVHLIFGVTFQENVGDGGNGGLCLSAEPVETASELLHEMIEFGLFRWREGWAIGDVVNWMTRATKSFVWFGVRVVKTCFFNQIFDANQLTHENVEMTVVIAIVAVKVQAKEVCNCALEVSFVGVS